MKESNVVKVRVWLSIIVIIRSILLVAVGYSTAKYLDRYGGNVGLYGLWLGVLGGITILSSLFSIIIAKEKGDK